MIIINTCGTNKFVHFYPFSIMIKSFAFRRIFVRIESRLKHEFEVTLINLNVETVLLENVLCRKLIECCLFIRSVHMFSQLNFRFHKHNQTRYGHVCQFNIWLLSSGFSNSLITFVISYKKIDQLVLQNDTWYM